MVPAHESSTEVRMLIGFDHETHLIAPGLLAPPPVCLTYDPRFDTPGICVGEEMLGHLRTWLCAPDVILVGANTAYDVGVSMEAWPELIPLWIQAYEENRVRDCQIDEMLIDIARGQLGGYIDGRTQKWVERGYSLADIEQRWMNRGRSAEKTDPNAWRLRYKELDGVPLSQWPKRAIDYAVEDAVGARCVSELQWLKYESVLRTESYAQARAALALHLMSAWGVRTHEKGVDALEAWVRSRYDELTVTLTESGLVRKNGTRDTKKARERICAAFCALPEGKIPITATGTKKLAEGMDPVDVALAYASLDKVACEDSEDPLMEAYAERTSLVTVVDTHLPALRKGLTLPIQPRYNVLVASGRTSCKGASKRGGPTNGYQIQNPKRESLDENEVKLPGVRECFTSRGHVAREAMRAKAAREGVTPHDLGILLDFADEIGAGGPLADADFSGLELCTVAQSCIDLVGFSKLGDALNTGIDPHLVVAAQILGITYDEAKARKTDHDVQIARQVGKVANFGFGGGLGPFGFSRFARKGYGVKISVERAKEIKVAWLASWPEFEVYFAYVKDLCSQGLAQVVQLRSGRVRGLVEYTAACNGFFQALGADGAKAAVWDVAREAYAVPESPLFGFRPWGFVHDQILGETTSLAHAHEEATQLGRVMVTACNRYLPNVPVKCSPCLSWVWSKEAIAVFHAPPADGGRLVPWDEAKDQKWRVFDDAGREVKW